MLNIGKQKKLNRQEAFQFERCNQFSIRKLTIGVVSLAIGASMVLQNIPVVEAGVDVWTKNGEKITDHDALTQDNIGTIQYVRGDNPQRYAGFDTFRTTWTVEEVIENGQKVYYVNVKHVFNERRDNFGRHFVVFNVPDSLYEPEAIVRKIYGGANNTTPTEVRNFTTWVQDPGNNASRWAESKRYVRINPDGHAGNVENGTVATKEVGPSNITDRISIEGDRWTHDWARIDWRYQTTGNGVLNTSQVYNDLIKSKSRSIYVDDMALNDYMVTYEYRARVKDYNAPMNHLLGYNQPAGGWNNYAAVFGTTPDNRPYNERFPLTKPERTIVDDLANLTEQNRRDIIAKIKAANPTLFNNQNSTGAAVITDIALTDVPTNSTGNITVRFTDGSTAAIPVSDAVTKKVVAPPPATTTEPPVVAKALIHNQAQKVAETTMGNKDSRGSGVAPFYIHTTAERQSMTRLALPDQLAVTDVGAVQNPDQTGLDPNNPNKTAEQLWNEKLSQVKNLNNISNVTGAKTYPTGTAINGVGTRFDGDSVTEDMAKASQSTATLKKENGKIVGILVSGPRYGDGAIQEAGIITSDMLFKKAPVADPLPGLKEQAKAEIDKLNLSATDKDSFKQAVQNATDQAGIEKALADAKKAESDLANAKTVAKAEIDKLSHLTPAEKNNYKTAIDGLQSTDAITDKVNEAKAKDLENAKTNGRETVSALPNLPQEDKDIFNGRIALATTSADVQKIVEEATAKDAAIEARRLADEQKQAAKDAIDNISGLTTEQKQEFKNQIDQATDPRAIDTIVDLAKGTAQAEAAKGQIEDLPYLNTAQKTALKETIEADKSLYNIEATLAEARELNNSMKYLQDLVAQADSIKSTDQYTNATPETKAAFDKALEAAKQVSTLEGQNADKQTVDRLVNNLKAGIEGLQVVPVVQQVNKDVLRAEHDLGNTVKATTKYTGAEAGLKAAYDDALTKANDILNNPDATQSQVDLALESLLQAKHALNGPEETNPAPVFGSFGVDATVSGRTYKTIYVFGAKKVNDATTENAPEFVPEKATAAIPVTDNTGIASLQLWKFSEDAAATDTGIAFNPDGKLVSTFADNASNLKVQSPDTGTWHHRIKATDTGNPANSSISQQFRIVAYRDDVTNTDPIQKIFGQAVTQQELEAKLGINVRSGVTVPTTDYTRKVVGYTPEGGEYKAVTDISQLPTSGNYTVKVETTNIYGQTIANNIEVDYNEQKDLFDPVAPAADKPALISVPVTADTPITSQNDKDAITAKVDKNNLPKDTTVTVLDGATVAIDPLTNKPVVPVTVTYPDGSEDIVNVPVKQADAAKYTPTAVETPIESSTATGTTLTPTERDAVKAAVTLPQGASGTVTVQETATVQEGTGANAGKPVVLATVTYSDDTEDTVEVPVKQTDAAKYTPSLKTPDAGQPAEALISVPVTADTPITSQADKDAITAKVDKNNLPKDTTVTVPDGAKVTIVEGNPVVLVKVTYPDGTKDEVNVPVKQADTAVFTATVTDETKPAVITSSDAVGTSITDPTDKQNILDKVTVPAVDGKEAPIASKEITSPVKEVEGKKVVEVTVTYEDGTVDTIAVPVKQADSDIYTPSLKAPELGQPAEALISVAPNPGTQITSQTDKDSITAKIDTSTLPKDTTLTVLDGATVAIDPLTNKPVVPVTVTYPDGSKDIVNVPVKQMDSATNNPTVKTPVEVKNPDALTEAEKKGVEDAVRKDNTLPDGTKVEVSDKGEVTITYPDGSKDNLPSTVATTPAVDSDKDGFTDKEEAAAGTDANDPASTPTTGTSADRLDQTVETPVEVKNPDALTEAEKKAVEDAVRKDNTLPDGTKVEVSDKGEVTITYPDGSEDKLPSTVTTTPAVDSDKDGFTDKEEAAAGTDAKDPASTPTTGTSADRLDPTVETPVEVKNPDQLTDAEKKAVEEEVRKDNELPEGTKVEVSDKGEVTITYPDGSKDNLPSTVATTPAVDSDKDGFTDKEEAAAGTDAKDPASTPTTGTSADRLDPTVEAPVEVKNPDALTEAEKKAVEEEVRKDNDLPDGTKVEVSDKGEVTITYPDGSKDSLPSTVTTTPAVDSDKDGFTDKEETAAGTDANNPAETPTTGTSADRLDPTVKTPVEVKNPDQLTDAEKKAVEDAVHKDNTLPEDTKVEVSDKGEVTITYPDGSKDSLPSTVTTTPAVDSDKDGFTDKEETAAGMDANNPAETPTTGTSADRLDPTVKNPVEVKNPDALTESEKKAVEEEVRKDNDFPDGTKVEVSDKGEVTITYPDGSKDSLPSTVTTTPAVDSDKDGFTDKEETAAGTDANNPAETPTTGTSADRLDPTVKTPVEVKNPDQLTDAEKKAVEDAVRKDNTLPEDTKVEVSDKGEVTITYPDGSKDSLPSTVTTTPEKIIAPLAPEVITTATGDVLITPPAENVTSLDITFTPEGSDSPVTVVATKDSNGNWTVPAELGLVVNSDGTITIPADKVKDGTAVTVIAKNGPVVSEGVGSTVVPIEQTNPIIPEKPVVTTGADGSVTITPPAENVTSLEITFTPEGSDAPITVTATKDATGNWTVPTDSGLVVNADGTITIPADRVKDGTENQVTVVAKNGEVSSEDTQPEIPVAPSKPIVTTGEDGSVTITPPAENVTSLDITFTPEGSDTPITVTATKDATGNWTVPTDSGLVVNADGTITIPADRVKDGTAVSAVAKNGQTPSNQAGTAVVPVIPIADRITPVVSVPVKVNNPSNLTDTEKQAVDAAVRKDNTLPEGTKIEVANDGTVTLTYSDGSKDTITGTAVVIAFQNGKGVKQSLPSYDLSADDDKDGFTNGEELEKGSNPANPKSVPTGQTTVERLTPSVEETVVEIENPSKLTDSEKTSVEEAVRKENNLPNGTKIEVSDTGIVTVTYPDGSVDIINSVPFKIATPNLNIDENQLLNNRRVLPGNSSRVLPNTGEENSVIVSVIGSSALLGLYALTSKRRRRED